MTIDQLLSEAEWIRDYAASSLTADIQGVLNSSSVSELEKTNLILSLLRQFSHSLQMITEMMKRADADISAGKEPEEWKAGYSALKKSAEGRGKNV